MIELIIIKSLLESVGSEAEPFEDADLAYQTMIERFTT